MLHPIYLGHFDREALSRGRIVSIRPLDMAEVRSRLEAIGEVRVESGLRVGKDRISVEDGYVRTTDFIQERVTVQLFSQLAKEWGCDIAFPECATLISPEELVKNFDEIQEYRRTRQRRVR